MPIQVALPTPVYLVKLRYPVQTNGRYSAIATRMREGAANARADQEYRWPGGPAVFARVAGGAATVVMLVSFGAGRVASRGRSATRPAVDYWPAQYLSAASWILVNIGIGSGVGLVTNSPNNGEATV